MDLNLKKKKNLTLKIQLKILWFIKPTTLPIEVVFIERVCFLSVIICKKMCPFSNNYLVGKEVRWGGYFGEVYNEISLKFHRLFIWSVSGHTLVTIHIYVCKVPIQTKLNVIMLIISIPERHRRRCRRHIHHRNSARSPSSTARLCLKSSF